METVKYYGIHRAGLISEDYNGILEQLSKRGIPYIISKYFILFEANQIQKLPTDDKGYFLPVDDTAEIGHSFYPVYDVEIK